MTQISLGNFGNSVAQPGPMVQAQRGDPTAQAMDRVGQIGAAAATDMMARDTENKLRLMRANDALDLAKAQNEMHDAHDQVARGVQDGSIDSAKAGEELSTRLSKITSQYSTGRLPEQQATMQAHFTGVTGQLQRNLDSVVQVRTQKDTASVLDQFGEQVSRQVTTQGPQWASEKYGAMVDFAGPSAGLNDAQRAKLKQSFSERAHASSFESAGVDALTAGNAQALGNLVEKLRGPDGDPLDPAKRTALTHQLYGWQQHVLAKQAAAANANDQEAMRRHNEALDLYNKGTDVALGGGYLSPDFITQLTTTAQGTEMEKPVLALIASQAKVAGFATMAAPQRAAIINDMRAQRATPGVGTDPAGDKLLNAVVTMNDKLTVAAKENPWQASQQAGVVTDAALLNPTDPSSAITVIQKRMGNIQKVEAWTGHKVSPLQPQEVEMLGKLVRQLPVDQAASMLATVGTVVGDSDRIEALAKQMHDKDGSLGLAMMYANPRGGDMTTEGRYTAELVLKGDQALRDKSVAVDDMRSTGWRAQISKQVRGLYSNRQVEDNVIDAAFKIAVAKSLENGSPNIDNVMNLATGGIAERNGQKFPLPYGWTEERLNQRINSITPSEFASQAPDGVVYAGRTPVSVDDLVAQLPKATLVHAGQGIYNVRAGSSVVTNKAGQRIIIKAQP